MIRSRSHLIWLRTLPCAIRGKGDHVCEGPTEAAHWRGSREGGMGMKPGDDKALPLCSAAHAEQHRIGERAFEQRYRFSMGDYCALYWAISERVINEKKTAKRKRHWPKRKLTHPTLKRKVNRQVVKRAA